MQNSYLGIKTEDELRTITDEVVKSILDNKKLKINKIILYGSYARGTAEEGSDIDIMVLCENKKEDVERYFLEVFNLADKVGLDHDILIQTDVQSEQFFNKWVETLPYYRNIKNEGVVLYG